MRVDLRGVVRRKREAGGTVVKYLTAGRLSHSLEDQLCFPLGSYFSSLS